MTTPRGIEATFNAFVTPEHVLTLAGFQPMHSLWPTRFWVLRLPDGRWQALARITGRIVRIQSRGFPFAGRQTWHPQGGGYFTFSNDMTAWACFHALIARHDQATAMRRAMRIPAVRAAMADQVGELIHA